MNKFKNNWRKYRHEYQLTWNQIGLQPRVHILLSHYFLSQLIQIHTHNTNICAHITQTTTQHTLQTCNDTTQHINAYDTTGYSTTNNFWERKNELMSIAYGLSLLNLLNEHRNRNCEVTQNSVRNELKRQTN